MAPNSVEKTSKRLRIVWRGADKKETTIADTTNGVVITEHGSPAYYFPTSDIDMALITTSEAPRTVCPWKGKALYHDFKAPGSQSITAKGRIWSYPDPLQTAEPIKGHLCFYPSSNTDPNKVGSWECLVD